MTSIHISELCVSLDDSRAFARLSGDYNPLHIDQAAARRLRFGGTVVHGVHLFMSALDVLATQGLFDRHEPVALSASFDNAVLTGTPVLLRASLDTNRVRVSAHAAGRSAFNGTLELGTAIESEARIEDAEFSAAYPHELPFPPQLGDDTVPLKLRAELLVALFPSLASLVGSAWIADLLATTQIVGMRCPGMHSIYSSLRLRRAARPLNSESIHFRITGIEKRLAMLRMQVAGSCLDGTIEAFFRPRPVAQRSMEEISRLVPSDAFRGHRALIVGGSRGLGELAAKIVACGGAEVTITYALGAKDAERITTEAGALGLDCTARHLDLMVESKEPPPEWLHASNFSHVYYFASPHISRSIGPWDEALFQQYTQMYVSAFATLVERTLAARTNQASPVHFLYPSSVFVTQPEIGFSEYAVAKAAGEVLCHHLQKRRGARFDKPRLPRMLTDQTSSIADIGAIDPLPVMLDVVRRLHS